MRPPPPLEWHPFYRNRTWLLDWLEQRGPYADLHDLLLPKLPVWAAMLRSEADVATAEPLAEPLRLTRHRAHGPAPYVGRPFRYVWHVAVDQYGRCIAGEAHIVYEREPWVRPANPAEAVCKGCYHEIESHWYGNPVVCRDCPDGTCRPMDPG